jgi:riboflavin synthase
MFTGLIAHAARVVALEPETGGGLRLALVSAAAVAEGVQPKDSIAVNGVCLTAVRLEGERVWFDIVPETVERSTLGTLRVGDDVNLELSLRLGDRLGGHFVYGHVDARVRIVDDLPEGRGRRLRIARPLELARFLVEKGSVALDGVSLTIAAVTAEAFAVALIPETATRTTLGRRTVGDDLNLEIDPIARYALGALESYEHEDREVVRSDELAWAYEI